MRHLRIAPICHTFQTVETRCAAFELHPSPSARRGNPLRKMFSEHKASAGFIRDGGQYLGVLETGLDRSQSFVIELPSSEVGL
jgi:hypothetical protein